MVNRRASRGFTLVEFLVAAAVTLVALGLAIALVGPSAAAFTALPEAIDAQQRLRVAVQAIADSLEAAGAGPVLGWGGRTAPAWPAVLPCRWLGGPLGALPGGCAADDAVSVARMELAAPQAIVDADVTAVDAPMHVVPLSACALALPACRVREDSRVLVADGRGAWDVVPVSAVSIDGTLIAHAGAPLSRLYAAGSIVGQAETAAFSVRLDPSTHAPQLRRVANGASDLPLVDHVTALRFEYFGAPAAPAVLDDADSNNRRATYGPVPPPAAVDDPLDTWAAGENCVFARAGGVPEARLAPLPVEFQGMARLPVASFADGPWCPDPASPNRFDADLLRVQMVRVIVRVEAQSDAVRGADALRFSRPGAAREAARFVPDLEVRIDVALRNAVR